MVLTSTPHARWCCRLPWLLAVLGQLGAAETQDRQLDLTERAAPDWQSTPSAQGDLYRPGPLTLPALPAPSGSVQTTLQLTTWALPWHASAIGPPAPGGRISADPVQQRQELSLRLQGAFGAGLGWEVVLRGSRVRDLDGTSPASWQQSLGDAESALVLPLSVDPHMALALVVGTLTPLSNTPPVDWLLGHGRLADGCRSGLTALRLASCIGAWSLQGRARLTASSPGENRLTGAGTSVVVHDHYRAWEGVLGIGCRISSRLACALESAWQRRTWSGADPDGVAFRLTSRSVPVLMSISTRLDAAGDGEIVCFAGADAARDLREPGNRWQGGILLTGWW